MIPIEDEAIRRTVDGIACITNPTQPAYQRDMVQAVEFWFEGEWRLLSCESRSMLLDKWTKE